MMDDKSKEMLNEILSKEPAALTDADTGFLRARRSYLNEEQRSVYKEVLAETFEPEPDPDEESEPEAPKRGRKAKVE